MSFSKIIQYILFVALVLLTVFNFYALTTGRKKKLKGEETFKKILRDLENRVFSEMKKNHISFDEKHGYINDTNQGFFLAFDSKNRKMGIATNDEFFLLGYDEVVSCGVKSDPLQRGLVTNVRVELETKEDLLVFVFGTKKWKTKSHWGAFLLSDAQEFCDFVNSHSASQ
ncbi:hypothetical protein SpiGrapes_2005 [Sphaerochaeta pleomorpha str. Grapes]|uniref:Uncharacterized protein n=1 Tax=Sphaerochaeta pleomorpha (strain ATCC BAA-1885 / DSM 22778 / Grapes) TaxID=158190 RepID=G8QQE7_SPHPG|nr:hypothetical protein [Sphaerochaeta pleomorpha]AEV29792.1 hypothetical protein SpiGrapes_2005 [Sphaerochaeta pleomorpha str. Grapes]